MKKEDIGSKKLIKDFNNQNDVYLLRFSHNKNNKNQTKTCYNTFKKHIYEKLGQKCKFILFVYNIFWKIDNYKKENKRIWDTIPALKLFRKFSNEVLIKVEDKYKYIGAIEVTFENLFEAIELTREKNFLSKSSSYLILNTQFDISNDENIKKMYFLGSSKEKRTSWLTNKDKTIYREIYKDKTFIDSSRNINWIDLCSKLKNKKEIVAFGDNYHISSSDICLIFHKNLSQIIL